MAFDPWTKRGALITLGVGAISVVIALVTLVIQVGGGTGTDPKASSSSTASPENDQTTGSANIRPGDCVSESGDVLSCTADSAWAVISDERQCSVSGVTSELGLNVAYEQLALRTVASSGECLARPESAELTAVAIVQARAGNVASGLRECLRSDAGGEVTCDEPHRWEWTSAWQFGDAEAGSVCASHGRGYTDRVLDGLDQPLKARHARRESPQGTEFRCALESREVLAGSVRGVGNNALPVYAKMPGG